MISNRRHDKSPSVAAGACLGRLGEGLGLSPNKPQSDSFPCRAFNAETATGCAMRLDHAPQEFHVDLSSGAAGKPVPGKGGVQPCHKVATVAEFAGFRLHCQAFPRHSISGYPSRHSAKSDRCDSFQAKLISAASCSESLSASLKNSAQKAPYI